MGVSVGMGVGVGVDCIALHDFKVLHERKYFLYKLYIVPTEPGFGSSHFLNSFAGQALGIARDVYIYLDGSDVHEPFVVLCDKDEIV